ncbi:MAG: hypothetical protein ABSH53_15205 [Holophaga sp.]|jgi:hypothetical protein
MSVQRIHAAVVGMVLLGTWVSCSGVSHQGNQSVKMIDLTYRPIAAGVVPAAKAGQEIVINKLKDEREPGPLGEASNYGGHVFFVVQTNNDVSAWVTKALATELGQAGFKVVAGDGTPDPQRFVVNGVVNEITVHGIITNMRLTLQVTKDYKVVANASFNSDAQGYKEPFFNTVYTEDYPQLFAVTLKNLMLQAVPTMVNAMNSEP